MKKPSIYALCALFVCLLFVSHAFAQTRGWGNNGNGELGIGSSGNNQPTPVTIPAVPDATGIGGGYLHTLFLRSNGTLVAAGSNGYGQSGDGTTSAPRTSPVPVTGLTNVTQATGGGYHSAALKADGTVWSWGYNFHGQMGNGTTTTTGCQCIPTPTQTSITNVVQIEAGFYHTLALKADGTVWSWGQNGNGQLGDNSQTNRPTPVQVGTSVPGFNNIIAVSAGEYHSMALKADGTVWVWGNNGNGQVGNGSTAPSIQLVPVQNTTLANVVQIAAGAAHNIALLKDGTVRVWGRNSEGEVGNGAAGGNQLTPVQTASITNAIEIEATGYSTAVRLRDGSIRAWGYNGYGQVGNGTSGSNQLTPVTTSVGTGNASLAFGYYHGFALKPVIPLAVATNQIIRGDNLRLTFANVTGAGNVSYTAIDPSAVAGSYTVPAGYTIQNNQPAYNVTTTATATGNIDVCIAGINEFNQTNFNQLRILHGEGANWVDRTVSATFMSRQLCARVSSLSPFVIAQSLAPTAANVSVSGRVINGKTGIARATVSITDASGTVRTAITNPFGYYRFEDLPVGQIYIVNVSAKGYEFAPQVVTLNEDLTEFNLIAIE